MEKVIRSLKIDGGYEAEVITKGNFSRIIVSFPSHPDRFFVLSLFLLDLFSEFENQLSLRILNWGILDDDRGKGFEGRQIIIHHEPKPKEKARVAHLPEAEPDIGL